MPAVIRSAFAFQRKSSFKRFASSLVAIHINNTKTASNLFCNHYVSSSFSTSSSSPSSSSSSSASSSSSSPPSSSSPSSSSLSSSTRKSSTGLFVGTSHSTTGDKRNIDGSESAEFFELEHNSNAYNNAYADSLNENSFTNTYESTSHMKTQVMIANESYQMNKKIFEVFNQNNVDMEFLWDYLRANENSINIFNMGFIFKNLTYKLRDGKENDVRRKFFIPPEIIQLFNGILIEKVQTRTTLNELSLYYNNKTENMFWWVISGLGCIREPHHPSVDSFIGTLSVYIDNSSLSFLRTKDIASVCYALRFLSSHTNPNAFLLLKSIVKKLEAAADSVEFDTLCIAMCMQGVKNFLIDHATMKEPMNAYLKLIVTKLESCPHMFDNKRIATSIEGLGACYEKNESVKKLLDIFAHKIKIDNSETFTAEHFSSCMMGLRRMQGNEEHVSKLMTALRNRIKNSPGVVFTPDTIAASFSGLQQSPSMNSEYITPRKDVKDMIIYLEKMLQTIPHEQMTLHHAGHIVNGLRNTNYPIEYVNQYGLSLQRIIEYIIKVIEMHPGDSVPSDTLKLFLNSLKGMKPSSKSPFIKKYIKVLLPKLTHFVVNDRFKPNEMVKFVSRLRYMDSREKEANDLIGVFADIVKIDYKNKFKLKEVCLMYGGLASTHLISVNVKSLVQAINEKARESLDLMEKKIDDENFTDCETMSIAMRGIQKFSSDHILGQETVAIHAKMWKYARKDKMTVMQLQRLSASLRFKNLNITPMRVLVDNIVQKFHKSRDLENFRQFSSYNFIGVISTPLKDLHYRCQERTGFSKIMLVLFEELIEAGKWPYSDDIPKLVRACAAISTPPPGASLDSDKLLPEKPDIAGTFTNRVSAILKRRDKRGHLLYDFYPTEFYEMIANTLKLRTKNNVALDNLFQSICLCYNPDKDKLEKYLGKKDFLVALHGLNRSVLQYEGGRQVIRKVTADFAAYSKSANPADSTIFDSQKICEMMQEHEDIHFSNEEIKNLYMTILNATYPSFAKCPASKLLKMLKTVKNMTNNVHYEEVDEFYTKLRESIRKHNTRYTFTASNPKDAALKEELLSLVATADGNDGDAYLLLMRDIAARTIE